MQYSREIFLSLSSGRGFGCIVLRKAGVPTVANDANKRLCCFHFFTLSDQRFCCFVSAGDGTIL